MTTRHPTRPSSKPGTSTERELDPFDQAVRDLYGRGLVEAREMRERVYEVGNDRPMVSSEIVVEGITAAGRAFIEQHGT